MRGAKDYASMGTPSRCKSTVNSISDMSGVQALRKNPATISAGLRHISGAQFSLGDMATMLWRNCPVQKNRQRIGMHHYFATIHVACVLLGLCRSLETNHGER